MISGCSIKEYSVKPSKVLHKGEWSKQLHNLLLAAAISFQPSSKMQLLLHWIWRCLKRIRSFHGDTTQPLADRDPTLHPHVALFAPLWSPWVLHYPVLHPILRCPIAYDGHSMIQLCSTAPCEDTLNQSSRKVLSLKPVYGKREAWMRVVHTSE